MNYERRQTERDMHYFWEELNLAQKCSVAELQRFGYELLFVRQQDNIRMAVMLAGDKLAAIDDEGQIDTEPSVILRH